MGFRLDRIWIYDGVWRGGRVGKTRRTRRGKKQDRVKKKTSL